MTSCQIYESKGEHQQPATDSGEYLDLDQIIKPTVLMNRDPENYTDLKEKEKPSTYQELVINTNGQKLSEEGSTHKDKETIYEVVETRFENFISWFSP